MATSPQFAASPKAWTSSTFVTTSGGTTAYTTASPTDAQLQGAYARSGSTATPPTGVVLLVTGGSAGSRIDEINFTCLTTSTANVGRIFLYDGTRYMILKEVAIPAVTVSASTPAASVTASFNNLVLPSSSYKIYVSVATVGTGTTDNGYAITAFGGDF